jgi:hypothetical protein
MRPFAGRGSREGTPRSSAEPRPLGLEDRARGHASGRPRHLAPHHGLAHPRGAALAALLGLAACGGAEAAAPTAALATTQDAQEGFEKLLGQWSRNSRAGRIAMKPALLAFQRQHAEEPVTRMVEAWLAWVALDEGNYGVAERDAIRAQKAAGPGTTADVARTVEGASLRRRGRSEQALARLSPLVSKLIDGYARALLDDEIVEAALAVRRYPRAFEFMRIWLREASADERAAIEKQLEARVSKVPTEALLGALRPSRGGADLTTDDARAMRRLVVQRLAEVALEKRDVDLAKRLLATEGPLLGDRGDAIAQLATGGARARVEARTVGLLISLRNDETRRRGVEVADGVAQGLGLPGSSARLVSRDDRGDPGHVDEALAALSADGASILIAGVDGEEASTAARFAEANQLPVLLLTAPTGRGSPGKAHGRFTFVLGQDPVAIEDALAAALAAAGARKIAILTDQPRRPRPAAPEVIAVRGCSEASAPWKPLGATGVVLDASCASEALVAAAPTRPHFAASIETGLLALPRGSLVATAGLYPIDPSRPPAALASWMNDHAVPPSFWAGLGHDAAVLAWTCVQALPERATEDPSEVAVRRAQTAQALATAQADLWTSEARGFNSARELPRTIGVRELK